MNDHIAVYEQEIKSEELHFEIVDPGSINKERKSNAWEQLRHALAWEAAIPGRKALLVFTRFVGDGVDESEWKARALELESEARNSINGNG
jgi:hypothetical protein